MLPQCLNIDPKERSSYPMLIAQIQGFIENYKMNATEEMKYQRLRNFKEKDELTMGYLEEKDRFWQRCVWSRQRCC